MAFANHFILAVGILLLLSIVASRVTTRLGAPLLLVFLVIGMLAGEEGPGGIVYNDVDSAFLLASLALAVILFDGGLRTRYTSFRTGLRPALWLATAGVVITAAVTGLAATGIFGFHWLDGLLLGAIVGSTDAAAVFYLLRAHGLQLNERVHATLEIESGVNDPMAVFLTLMLIEAIGRYPQLPAPLELLWELGWQMGGGAVVGLAAGAFVTWLVNRLELPDSLYPLLVLGGGIATYGLAASLGGSGFLAAYVAGLLCGNGVRRSANGIRRFHDGMAWLSQIGLFLLLGLLVTPSDLLPAVPGGLLTALVLVFVARPLAVALCLWPFRFSLRERLFISWVGLRGAVPIVLGLYPLLAGVSAARTDFNIAFCVVLVSLVLQGWTVAPVARWLGVRLPPAARGRRLAELDLPGLPGRELVVYEAAVGSPALGHAPVSLPLPEGSECLALLRRGGLVVGPQARLEAGDHVYLMAPVASQTALEDLFGSTPSAELGRQQRFYGEFVLSPDVRLRDLAEVYDLDIPPDVGADSALTELFERRYGKALVVGDRVRVGAWVFVARQVDDGRVAQVGLKMPQH